MQEAEQKRMSLQELFGEFEERLNPLIKLRNSSPFTDTYDEMIELEFEEMRKVLHLYGYDVPSWLITAKSREKN